MSGALEETMNKMDEEECEVDLSILQSKEELYKYVLPPCDREVMNIPFFNNPN